MKTLLLTLLAMPLGFPLVLAQPSSLTITAFSPGGYLAWTNHLRPAQPVYEVLVAPWPSGPWERFATVTNQHSVQLPSPGLTNHAAAFFQLAWVDEALIEFDYVFDEGYGFPAVSGHVSFGLLPHLQPQAGTWSFEDTGSIDRMHPLGVGLVRRVSWTVDRRLRVWLTGPVEGAFLEGTFSRGDSGDGAYTYFAGTVYQDGFAGPSPIGVFVATVRP